jgi:hypothetical protein
MTHNKEVTYFSESRNEDIPVSSMVDQHVRNAFTKMLREDSCNTSKALTIEKALHHIKEAYKLLNDVSNGLK